MWTEQNKFDVSQIVVHYLLKDVHPHNVISYPASCQLLIGSGKVTEDYIVVFFVDIVQKRLVVVLGI